VGHNKFNPIFIDNERLLGCKYFVKAKDGASESTGIMDKLFLELQGAFQMYAECGEDNVISFDATHKTNRHNLKLCMFLTIGKNGETFWLALCLLDTESAQDVL